MIVEELKRILEMRARHDTSRTHDVGRGVKEVDIKYCVYMDAADVEKLADVVKVEWDGGVEHRWDESASDGESD